MIMDAVLVRGEARVSRQPALCQRPWRGWRRDRPRRCSRTQDGNLLSVTPASRGARGAALLERGKQLGTFVRLQECFASVFAIMMEPTRTYHVHVWHSKLEA